LRHSYAERVLERAGCPGDAIALAMRVLAGVAVGLRMERDLAALLPLQLNDGEWGNRMCVQVRLAWGLKIGKRGVTTALALNAIVTLYTLAHSRNSSSSSWDVAFQVAQWRTRYAPRAAHLAAMGIPFESPQHEIQKETFRERGFSASAIAKGVNFGSPTSPPPQACKACTRPCRLMTLIARSLFVLVDPSYQIVKDP